MARMTIKLPDDIVELIARIAERQEIPKTEVIRRAFAILQVAEREKSEHGYELGLIDPSNGANKAVARLIGI